MKIAFLGGGHMAQALIGGLHRQADIVVADRNAARRDALAGAYGVQAVATLPHDMQADALVLAVRPPQAKEACATLPPPAQSGVLVSVVAGLRTADLMQASGRSAAQVVRTMPNTPAQLGLGMTFAYADAQVAPAARQLTAQVFEAVGHFAWVGGEPLLDAVTAVSGSAPAYVYYFIEAMQRAAKELGIEDAAAQAAILQTIRGACAMVEQGDKTPTELCRAVAVPGGTTAQALQVMYNAGMQETIAEAMRACTARAREMGEELAGKA